MASAFVDFYEALQLSPNATGETIERVYRLLAKRYHPDNQSSGDAQKFADVLKAFEVLSNASARAEYDVRYDEARGEQWHIFDQQSAGDDREEDRRLFHGILSLLYIARRRDPHSGGLGSVTLEKMLGCPQQHLEFPLWYLKARGWIQILDTGQVAITIDGIDKLSNRDLEVPKDRLIAKQSEVDSVPASRSTPRLAAAWSAR